MQNRNISSATINLYNEISDKILNLILNDLEKGIWNIISSLENDIFNFKTIGFKSEFSISQLFATFG